MYRLAYEESQRALEDQMAQLDGMRLRTTQILAFIGTATAFLVGTGVGNGDKSVVRDTWFYVLSGLGTLTFLATLCLAGTVLLGLHLVNKKPRIHNWNSRLSAGALVRWIEADVPPPDEAAFLRAVAKDNDRSADENDVQLATVRKAYVWFVMLASTQLLVWAALVWARG